MKHLKFASWKQPRGRPRFKENKFPMEEARKLLTPQRTLNLFPISYRLILKKNHKQNKKEFLIEHTSAPQTCVQRTFQSQSSQRGLISFLIRESNGILKKPPPPFPSPALLDRNSFVSTVGKRNVMAGRLSQVQLRLIPSEWSENGGAPVRWNNQRRQQGRRDWKGRVSIIKCRVTHPGN